jgi:hypothetical protein
VKLADAAGLGAIFVGYVASGFAGGWIASHNTHATIWIPIGMFAGIVFGGAVVLLQSLKFVR